MEASVVEQAIVAALRTAGKPLSGNQVHEAVRRKLRVPRALVEQRIEALAATGQLYRFPPYGSRLPRYFHQPPQHYAATCVRALCAKKPLRLRDIVRKAAKPSGVSEAELRDVVHDLVTQGLLWRHPPRPRSRTELYGTEPPRPEAYFDDVVQKVVERSALLAAAGVDRAQTLQALWARLVQACGVGGTDRRPPQPAPVDIAERILAALVDVDPEAIRGALVPVRQVRRHPQLQGISKEAFDEAMLSLARQRKISLHRHDFPAQLDPEQRRQLVEDEDGNLYIGAALLEDR